MSKKNGAKSFYEPEGKRQAKPGKTGKSNLNCCAMLEVLLTMGWDFWERVYNDYLALGGDYE